MQRIAQLWTSGAIGKLVIGCGGLLVILCLCGLVGVLLPGGDTQQTSEEPAATQVVAEAEPTATPEPTETPLPTNTPRPTNTPQPTDTPTPAPPTATSPPTPTATPAPPTATPQPTVPPAPVGPVVRIVAVNKKAEYVDIRNDGDQPQDLGGWVLVSEKGDQACTLGGVVNPGETLRIWARAEDAEQGGYNCRFDRYIWNNDESDPAALYDAAGQLVDRYP